MSFLNSSRQVSIVIPTLNESATIVAAIDAARNCNPFEIIVVDGGSTDNTITLASRMTEKVYRCKRGRAVQQNFGAGKAKGDILLFLHADTLLDPDSLNQINAALQNPHIGCGAFRQRIESASLSFRIIEIGNSIRARWFSRPYGDQAIFVRREIFERIGGFPEIGLLEEIHLMRKLNRITKTCLLSGPLKVSPRRWEKNGIVRQTLRNWLLVVSEWCGVHPNKLEKFYDMNSNLNYRNRSLRKAELVQASSADRTE